MASNRRSLVLAVPHGGAIFCRHPSISFVSPYRPRVLHYLGVIGSCMPYAIYGLGFTKRRVMAYLAARAYDLCVLKQTATAGNIVVNCRRGEASRVELNRSVSQPTVWRARSRFARVRRRSVESRREGKKHVRRLLLVSVRRANHLLAPVQIVLQVRARNING